MMLEVLVIFNLIFSVFSDTPAPENKYLTYIQGDINIIISVPHGGQKEYRNNKTIPDRKPGCKDETGTCQFGEENKTKNCKKVCSIRTGADLRSELIARTVYDKFVNKTGKKPSFIKSELHRKRLDPNREVKEAAQGNAVAIEVYNAFHDSIEHAIKNFDGKPGFLLDFHGYYDKNNRQNNTMLGYLIKPENLDKGKYSKEDVSVKALVERTNLTVDEILFGKGTSFGSLFEDSGYHALPSPRQHSPKGDKYFDGGFIVQTYGSRKKGNVDAIQLEFQSWIRSKDMWEDSSNEEVRDRFCEELANNIYKFYQLYYEPNYGIVSYGTYSKDQMSRRTFG